MIDHQIHLFVHPSKTERNSNKSSKLLMDHNHNIYSFINIIMIIYFFSIEFKKINESRSKDRFNNESDWFSLNSLDIEVK